MQVKLLRTLVGSAALAGVLAVATPTAANAQMGFVAQASYAIDGAEALGIGGGVNFGIGSLTEKYGIRLETTFDYFLVDDPASLWQINGNLLYDLKSVPNLYLGAGVNYSKFGNDGGEACVGTVCVDFDGASNSDIGLNILGGYKLGSGKMAPFVQARFELGGGEQLVVTGGIRF
jgi:hypothetical protein